MKPMHIEVFFVPGCPHHQPVVQRLREVMKAEAIVASIQEIAVTDERMAVAFKFPGSPTVRVNGQDVEPMTRRPYGLACRLYASEDGLPSVVVIKRALVARETGNQRR